MIQPNPSTETHAFPKLQGPPRPPAYSYVGRVRKLRKGMGLPTNGELPGKVALAICTSYGDATVAYFDPARRPKVGARVGVQGTWLMLDVEIDVEHTDCELCKLGAGNAVDFQLEVEHWSLVPAGHDPLWV